MDPDSRTRKIPVLKPSFLKFTFSVMYDCTQQKSVPSPKVKRVPKLWIGSSTNNYKQIYKSQGLFAIYIFWKLLRNNITWKFPTSVIPKQAVENANRQTMFSHGFCNVFLSWRYRKTAMMNPKTDRKLNCTKLLYVINILIPFAIPINAARFMISLKMQLAGGELPAILKSIYFNI